MKAKRSIGVLLILGAALCFALMNLFVNAAGELPVMQKVFFRNLVATVIVFFLLLFDRKKFRIKSRKTLLWLFLRSAVGFLGVVLNFYAIDHIGSISDASILNKLSPFFAILFSAFLLREKPTIPEIVFVLIAFAGAVCVVDPSFSMKVLPAASGVLGGACAGFAYSCVRVLGQKGERGNITVFFFSAFSTLVALPFFVLFFTPMSALQVIFLLLSGLAAAGGQFCITAAYRFAPAKEIAVYDYAQVLFAAVLGYFFLEQVPSLLSLIGYAIILFAAIARRSYDAFRTKASAPASAQQTGGKPQADPPPQKNEHDTG